MATNKKITALTELSSVQWADDDVVPIVDVSEQATKKIQLSVFRNAVGGALAPVLLGGNTTGGTDIVVSSGDAITTNTISETTAASGVTIDSLLVKDGGITAAGTSTFAGQTITDLGTVTTADINGGTITGITDLAVADGGTGASDAATARTNLGLGSISTQAANSVNIDGGTIDGTTIGGSSAAAGTFTTFTSTGIDDNAASTAITIDSSQNVGIGTTSPAEKLEVTGNIILDATDADIKLKSGVGGTTGALRWTLNTDSTSYADISLPYDTRSTVGLLLRSANGYPITIDGGNGVIFKEDSTTETMRIDSSGRLLVGSTSITSSLGAIATFDGTVFSDTENRAANPTFAFAHDNFSSDSNNYIMLDRTSEAMKFNVAGSERLRIDSSGNVGIGTTSPGVPLHISSASPAIRLTDTDDNSDAQVGAAAGGLLVLDADINNEVAGTAILFRVDGGSEKMRIDSSGNVGIGTSSPLSAAGYSWLTINGATSYGGIVSLSSANTELGRLQSTSSSTTLSTRTAAPLLFNTNTAERMRISSTGNVGIGTSSPGRPLDVNGSIRFASGGVIEAGGAGGLDTYIAGVEGASGRWAFATNGSERMRIDSSGNVGINNTAPAGLLEVDDVNISGSSGEDGFLVGSTGQIQHSTDNAIAMYMNDSSSAAGTHNYIVFRYQGSTIGDIDTTDNSTIRYQTFTGAHWAQFADHSQPEIPLGTVMSTINEMCNHTQFEYVDGEGETQKTDIAGDFEIGSTHTIYINEDGAQAEGTAIAQSTHKRLAKVKVSDTAGDKSVYGVFAGHYKDGDSSIESLGLGAIRVGSDVTVANGDLLESAGDGTARPQTGDNADLFKASTIAKVTSTVVIKTYDDGSYTVPCTLHCG